MKLLVFVVVLFMVYFSLEVNAALRPPPNCQLNQKACAAFCKNISTSGFFCIRNECRCKPRIRAFYHGYKGPNLQYQAYKGAFNKGGYRRTQYIKNVKGGG